MLAADVLTAKGLAQPWPARVVQQLGKASVALTVEYILTLTELVSNTNGRVIVAPAATEIDRQLSPCMEPVHLLAEQVVLVPPVSLHSHDQEH